MIPLEPFGVAVALKAAVVFLLGMGGAWLVRGAPPAVQHRLWIVVFAGALSLPLLMVALPGLHLVPRAPTELRVEEALPGGGRGEDFLLRGAQVGLGEAVDDQAWASTAGPSDGGEARGSRDGASGLLRTILPGAAAALWLAGVGVLLLRLGWGLRTLRRLRRRSRRVRDPARLEELSGLAREVGVDPRRIDLVVSEAAATPATWGLRRPVVLLPESVASGPAEVRRTVLLHELLHVRRRDWAVQMMALVTCALHWFNPLAWIAQRKLRSTGERAVDEAVVAAGISRSEYASRLIDLVRALGPEQRARPLAASLGHASSLEERIRSLLGTERRSAGGSRLTMRAVTWPLVAGFLALAALDGRPEASGAGQEPVAISEEPLLSVGVAEGDPMEEFHDVVTPFLLPDGRLVVPVAGSRTIRVFGPDGTFLEELGGRGEGPGEFSGLSSAWGRGDTIEVSDGSLNRITRFLPDGGVEVVTLDPIPSAGGATPEPLADGWVLAGVASGGAGERDDIRVHRFSLDGSHVRELARLPGMARYTTPVGGGPTPLSPRALVAVRQERVYAAETLTPEIRVLDPSGALERTVVWEPEAQPSPEEALRIVVDSAAARGEPDETADLQRHLLNVAREAPMPERVSALWNFIVDEEGYLWVLPYDPSRHAAALGGFGSGSYLLGGSGPGGTWRIFAPDGSEVGSVQAPATLEPVFIASDAVVGIHRDELGVESVRVHSLERR